MSIAFLCAKNSDYSKFKIKTVVGANDYASMKEVITRRLSHAIKENTEGKTSSFTRLPDLILMDGGKTQVHAAEEVLLAFGMDIPVCGMVKDDRHRTRGLPRFSERYSAIRSLSSATSPSCKMISFGI